MVRLWQVAKRASRCGNGSGPMVRPDRGPQREGFPTSGCGRGRPEELSASQGRQGVRFGVGLRFCRTVVASRWTCGGGGLLEGAHDRQNDRSNILRDLGSLGPMLLHGLRGPGDNAVEILLQHIPHVGRGSNKDALSNISKPDELGQPQRDRDTYVLHEICLSFQEVGQGEADCEAGTLPKDLLRVPAKWQAWP